MRALIQRVAEARVHVDDEIIAEIDRGLCILIGVTTTDEARDVDLLTNKIAHLRIFEDAAGKFNHSALELDAEILVVSQFTLYADTRRGRRPDFLAAARPDQAEPLIDSFCDHLQALGLRVSRGRFRAKMLVEIHNAGPVTIWLDSKA